MLGPVPGAPATNRVPSFWNSHPHPWQQSQISFSCFLSFSHHPPHLSFSVPDMYEIVLIDSPLGQFFQRTEKKDFDEFSMEYIRSLLCKNYYEHFYDFCRELGGETWVCHVLPCRGYQGRYACFEVANRSHTGCFSVRESDSKGHLRLPPRNGTPVYPRNEAITTTNSGTWHTYANLMLPRYFLPGVPRLSKIWVTFFLSVSITTIRVQLFMISER